MAYRYGDRLQMNLFPQSIEDYVDKDDPVRAYDAFVESLSLAALGIVVDENQVGNPEYEPKAMIKLLLYGYSYGIRSSRKLERALCHNVSFIWLMGGLKPDHKTIARFRSDNKRALKEILKQSARLCIKLGLIEGNTLFVDGSKLRANAAIDNTWTQDKCDQYLRNIDERIENILKECETADEKEQNSQSLVKLREDLKDKEALKSKIQDIIKELNATGLQSINSTDPDCVKVKGRQGTHSGYNGQIVVDEKNGLIVSSDVVNNNNDRQQFAGQIEQAHENLERKCDNACADAGYADTDELAKIDAQDVNVIVPSQEQISDKEASPFDKEHFTYDAKNDCYICPQGHKLNYQAFWKEKNCKIYKISKKALCLNCEHFGVCTTSKAGRQIKRLVNAEIKLKLEKQYETQQSQAIFRLRKQKVELPFGHIKRNLGVTSFLLRGLDGVRAEMSLLSSCFNMARLISIVGVQGLIARLPA
jgi:transposase